MTKEIVVVRDSVAALVGPIVAGDALPVVGLQVRVHERPSGRLSGLQLGRDGHAEEGQEDDG